MFGWKIKWLRWLTALRKTWESCREPVTTIMSFQQIFIEQVLCAKCYWKVFHPVYTVHQPGYFTETGNWGLGRLKETPSLAELQKLKQFLDNNRTIQTSPWSMCWYPWEATPWTLMFKIMFSITILLSQGQSQGTKEKHTHTNHKKYNRSLILARYLNDFLTTV